MATSLRFAHFELRPAQRLLLAHGEPVYLGSRAFDLLLAFAERPSELLRKSELMDRVWPRAVVTENNLHVQISGLRRVLGVRAIVSISGHGYRFTLPVSHGDSQLTKEAVPLSALRGPVCRTAQSSISAITTKENVATQHRSVAMLSLWPNRVTASTSRYGAEALNECMGMLEACTREVLSRHAGVSQQPDMLGMTCLFGLATVGEDD